MRATEAPELKVWVQSVWPATVLLQSIPVPVIVPPEGGVMVRVKVWMKVAPTVLFASMVTLQGLVVPLQAPLQAVKL